MDAQTTTIVKVDSKVVVDEAVKMLENFNEETKKELLIFMQGVQFGEGIALVAAQQQEPRRESA